MQWLLLIVAVDHANAAFDDLAFEALKRKSVEPVGPPIGNGAKLVDQIAGTLGLKVPGFAHFAFEFAHVVIARQLFAEVWPHVDDAEPHGHFGGAAKLERFVVYIDQLIFTRWYKRNEV